MRFAIAIRDLLNAIVALANVFDAITHFILKQMIKQFLITQNALNASWSLNNA
jgi:hypothetical protein